ncbi:hypothetical protein AVEN_105889-1 [Araneus ventricosus]|uniref:Uncharacterized protein n=1 Tax=Araneus ventricosus TaxID=182803 RepID=A0A4Y2M9T9_ARAVE|nr:hypothetical protein AVEN_105889-1 [Araneus ventricosus]
MTNRPTQYSEIPGTTNVNENIDNPSEEEALDQAPQGKTVLAITPGSGRWIILNCQLPMCSMLKSLKSPPTFGHHDRPNTQRRLLLYESLRVCLSSF